MLPTDMALTLKWCRTTFSAEERGVRSSSVRCWSSLLLGECTPGYMSVLPLISPSFVEDRTYKLLIVDSIMNLFRESSTALGPMSGLTLC